MLQRVLTALVAGAITLTAMLSSAAWPIALLVSAAAIVSFLELSRLVGYGKFVWAPALVGILCAVLVLAGPSSGSTAWLWLVAGVASLALFVSDRSPFKAALASGWIVAPLAAAYLAHQASAPGSGFGPNVLVLAVLPLWAGDTAGLFVGKALGKRPLAPAISPKKTWEGAFGNLAAAVLAGWGLSYWVGAPPAAGLAVGASCGVLGQAGDLLQSAAKRAAGLKDSGGLLPGHGGVLDRIDSLLLSCVPSLTLAQVMAPGLFHVKLF